MLYEVLSVNCTEWQNSEPKMTWQYMLQDANAAKITGAFLFGGEQNINREKKVKKIHKNIFLSLSVCGAIVFYFGTADAAAVILTDVI